MTALLNHGAMAAARRHREPFAWAEVEQSFANPATAARLGRAFPTEGFARVERTGGAKPYQMWVRPLIHRGDRAPRPAALAGLDPIWGALCAELGDPGYLAWLRDLGAVDGAVELEVNLWRYDQGSWLAPHLDKVEKRVSQVLYLSEAWDAGWGGELLLLRSGDLADVGAAVVPTPGRSVILPRSPRSWHAVRPVGQAGAERRSLQVVLWRSGSGDPETDGG